MMRLIETHKIWDRAPHNAFTDLIRFKGRWFCAFREGSAHVSPDGALRILVSSDGERWDTAASIESPISDLRDPKLTVTPDGRLMLCGAESLHDRSAKVFQSLVWFSNDGCTWSEKHEIGDSDFWIWRIRWCNGKAYGIGYGCRKDHSVRLYYSDDGIHFATLVERLFDTGRPTESAIEFDGNTAYCLLRRDGEPNTGLIGMSHPPYMQWEWKDLGIYTGGPQMIRLHDGHFLAVVRLLEGGPKTTLCRIDPERGGIVKMLEFPSGGDTSYAGMAVHDGMLWVSYYSSHEEKTAIYLAKVALDLKES